MASLQSIDKKRESLKKLLIDEVKPWLDANLNTDYLNIGVEAQLKHLNFIERVFNEFSSFVSVTNLPFSSTDHGLKTHVDGFLQKTLAALGSLETSLSKISKFASRKDNTTYDRDGFKDALYSFTVANACAVSYSHVLGFYKNIKENKELCDHVFDQDRDFWKKL